MDESAQDLPDDAEGGASSDRVVAAILVAGAIVAALSSAAPTGLRFADALWCALAAVAVAWAASRASRLPLAWLGAVALVVGVGGGWFAAACGLAVLATAVLTTSGRTPSRVVAALSGALAIQALLRGPSYGFVGLPTVVAFAGVLPALVSGWRRSPRSERRIANRTAAALGAFVAVGVVTAGAAALLARPHLVDASDQAEAALAILRDGDITDSVAPLADATDGFSSASDTLNGPLALVGRAVPVVGQHLEALGRVSTAGEDLAATAGNAASSANYEDIKADNGRVDLDRVRAMAAPVQASADALVAAQRVVAEVRSPWLIGPVDSELDRLDDELTDTAPAAVDAADAIAIVPALLGGDGTQRYLMMFATPGESRNAGGFVGTYGVLRAEQGSLTLEATGSTVELVPPELDPNADPAPFPFDPPPGWEDLYSSYYVQYFPGNVSASPDWPTDSEVARQVYAHVPSIGETDGVLYADPAALAALLQLTGPVDVPGVDGEIDAENVEQYLFVDQYVQYDSQVDQRRDVLAEVTRSVFEALTSRPLPAFGDLRAALGPVVAGGHLKFVSFDDRAEDLLVRTGVAGAWRTEPGADWLSVRSINLLPNKIDWFLRRTVSVESAIDPTTATITSTVTVQLRNLSPAEGLPSYLIDNPDALPAGTNHDGLSLYTPHELTGLTIDGVAAGVESKLGYGGHVYTASVLVPPGGEATVVFQLRGSITPAQPYRLDVLHQALAHDDDLSVRIGSGGGDGDLLFEGPLIEDEELIAIGT